MGYQRTIGFIGLGVMGASMARNLLRAGNDLIVYNRTARSAESLAAEGARCAASPAELGAQAEIVFLSVSDGPAVEDVLFGKNGLVQSGTQTEIVADLSTIAPDEARRIGARLAEKKIQFLDAPVTGGDVGARNGTLTIMAGGAQEAYTIAHLYFEQMGKNILHCGALGSGQLTKIINQIVVGLNIAAMTEGLVSARQYGLDLETTLRAISAGAAGSWALSNYAPRLLKGDMKPGFAAKHMLKDLRIALNENKSHGLHLPGLKLVTELYEKLCALGHGELGNHALLRIYDGRS